MSRIQKIIEHKKLTQQQIGKEWEKFQKYDATTNKNSFCGNKLIYHAQMQELCKTHREKKLSLNQICDSNEHYEKLKIQTEQRARTGTFENRLFECWRINNGSITFFKPTTAAYLYKKYNATKVLDPTAGWGGRAMAAKKLGISYIGMDTNTNLKDGYEFLVGDCENIKMIWGSCLEQDYSKLDYDFCLTSPPYENIEMYSNMTPWQTESDFYKNFLIPLLDKVRKYNKGLSCFNISPQMYHKLTVKYHYEKCDFVEDLKEQKNGKTPDNLYFWGKK